MGKKIVKKVTRGEVTVNKIVDVTNNISDNDSIINIPDSDLRFKKRVINKGVTDNEDLDDDDEDDTSINKFLRNLWVHIVEFGVYTTVLIVCFIMLFSNLFLKSLFEGSTGAEKIAKIQEQINEAKQENIDIANEQLVTLNNRKDNILKGLSLVMNDINIYEHCIALNKDGALPVDCSSVTLSLQQQLNWRVNSNGVSQEFKELKEQSAEGRTTELLEMYPSVAGTIDIWDKFEKQYAIKKEVAISIAKADSSLGDELSSVNNIGNVGNNDRGDKVHYSTIEDGIEAIYKTLNNKYLGNIYNIGYLSQGGRVALGAPSCSIEGEYCYATSEENWNINVINTLRLLYNDGTIDETFEFRIK